jgi:hypothetical protein
VRGESEDFFLPSGHNALNETLIQLGQAHNAAAEILDSTLLSIT